MITESMLLGKAIYGPNGDLLLPAGAKIIQYKANLETLRIKHIYIIDDISQDIDIQQVLSDDTKQEAIAAMKAAAKLFQPSAKNRQSIPNLPYDKLARYIAEDVWNKPAGGIDVSELRLNRQYPYGHELNVGILAALIGRLFGLSCQALTDLCYSGLVHEIGFLNLPPDIVKKIGNEKLGDSEFSQYRQYPRIGYDLIKNNYGLSISTKANVLQHREHFNGKGFPNYKQGEEIRFTARVLCIADHFDELYSGRNVHLGKKSMKIYEIMEFIVAQSGHYFDPDIVTIFSKNATLFPNGAIVRLNNGMKGIILSQNKDMMSRPVVRLLNDANGNPVKGTIDLLQHLTVFIDDVET